LGKGARRELFFRTGSSIVANINGAWRVRDRGRRPYGALEKKKNGTRTRKGGRSGTRGERGRRRCNELKKQRPVIKKSDKQKAKGVTVEDQRSCSKRTYSTVISLIQNE